jgi:hypothetical protein
MGADGATGVFYCCHSPQIDSDGAVEFERSSAGCGFGVAEHHTDFHTDLIYENKGGFAFVDDGGELSHCLAH